MRSSALCVQLLKTSWAAIKCNCTAISVSRGIVVGDVPPPRWQHGKVRGVACRGGKRCGILRGWPLGGQALLLGGAWELRNAGKIARMNVIVCYQPAYAGRSPGKVLWEVMGVAPTV